MKSQISKHLVACFASSPSMRREWIEMRFLVRRIAPQYASPSMRREWIEMRRTIRTKNRRKSPSMRREWIEISFAVNYGKTWEVSLHAEGVD